MASSKVGNRLSLWLPLLVEHGGARSLMRACRTACIMGP